jgi:capsular polysaccharide transport system permease protein
MAVEPNLGLLFHRNVRVMDLFLSRVILEIAGATVSLMVLSAGFVALGWMEPPVDLLRAIAAWLLLAWFAAALSLLVGALTERFEVIERVWHTFTYLLFPLSGAVFMVDWLPRAWHDPILLLPMVHGVEMLRSGWFGSAVTTHFDAGYLASVTMVLSFAGIALARDAGRRVKPA